MDQIINRRFAKGKQDEQALTRYRSYEPFIQTMEKAYGKPFQNAQDVQTFLEGFQKKESRPPAVGQENPKSQREKNLEQMFQRRSQAKKDHKAQ
ncbi:MAG: hypothetical protein GX786_06280, partial [Clostridiales bacterium]|nr:hypothetical protein [Clostridiales bacterium]